MVVHEAVMLGLSLTKGPGGWLAVGETIGAYLHEALKRSKTASLL